MLGYQQDLLESGPPIEKYSKMNKYASQIQDKESENASAQLKLNLLWLSW